MSTYIVPNKCTHPLCFAGTSPLGDVTSGSRMSEKAPWFAHMWSEKAGNAYQERAGKGSAVEEGYKAIPPVPTP